MHSTSQTESTLSALRAFVASKPILFSSFADEPAMARALALAMGASSLEPERAVEAHAIARAECVEQLQKHGAVDLDVAGLCQHLYDSLDLLGFTWQVEAGEWTAPAEAAA